ncbi:MAG: hypothetical protein FD133_1039 [Erysipelotrichaceae bacterium]|nr:MAG: hypothetical protein FD179_88 [Erysipelotrichaceae bacterium]TXT18203.1 MAG: hypothetical protein FD133_1039 [Erysipelotrichaceae bacterium]
MIQFMNYIDFNGNALAAVEFYTEVFKLDKPKMFLYKDVPTHSPTTPETENLIAHANLKIGDFTLMFSDTPPGKPVKIGENLTLFVQFDNLDEQKAVYDKLKVNARVIIPLSETYWSKSYTYLIDQFEIGWQLDYVEPEKQI